PAHFEVHGGRGPRVPVGVGDAARGEDERARPLVDLVVSDLGRELAFDHVPTTVFVVVGVEGSGEGLGTDWRFEDAERGAAVRAADQGAGLDAAELEGRTVSRPRNELHGHGHLRCRRSTTGSIRTRSLHTQSYVTVKVGCWWHSGRMTRERWTRERRREQTRQA